MTTPTRPDQRRIDNPAGREFRDLLDGEPLVFAPGLYHALDARLAEMAGHDAVYMSGYSTVLGQFGYPDLDGDDVIEVVGRAGDALETIMVPMFHDPATLRPVRHSPLGSASPPRPSRSGRGRATRRERVSRSGRSSG